MSPKTARKLTDFPDEVGEAILARLDNLHPVDLEVVKVASVLSSEFDLGELGCHYPTPPASSAASTAPTKPTTSTTPTTQLRQ